MLSSICGTLFVSLEPLLVLIEYVPFGDLLGYLRKSRGINDTYYKDPDIKPQTNLTSQQLMKFAWQIADGMSYLSSIPVSDAIILLGTTLQNRASFFTQYTSLSVESWTHCLGYHPMSLSHPQASRFVTGCSPKETFSLC